MGNARSGREDTPEDTRKIGMACRLVAELEPYTGELLCIALYRTPQSIPRPNYSRTSRPILNIDDPCHTEPHDGMHV